MKKKKGNHSGGTGILASRRNVIRKQRPLAASHEPGNEEIKIISVPKRFGPAADEEME